MNLKHHTATNPTQVSNVGNGKVGKETGSSTFVVCGLGIPGILGWYHNQLQRHWASSLPEQESENENPRVPMPVRVDAGSAMKIINLGSQHSNDFFWAGASDDNSFYCGLLHVISPVHGSEF